jgi:hypothetical protein
VSGTKYLARLGAVELEVADIESHRELGDRIFEHQRLVELTLLIGGATESSPSHGF